MAQFNVFSSHDTRRLRYVFPDVRRLKAVIIMQFTLMGAPSVYYGEELGMIGGKDPDNRATMRWDVFNDLIHHKSEDEIFNLYKQLINLRKTSPCLISAPVLTLFANDQKKTYSYGRYNDESDCVIVVISKDGLQEDLNLDIFVEMFH